MTTTTTGSYNIKDIIQVLHPIRYATFHNNSHGTDIHKKKPQRFSTLLLEHGEQELQDWSVIASSRKRSSSSSSSSSSRGTKQRREDGATNVSLSLSSRNSSSSRWREDSEKSINKGGSYVKMTTNAQERDQSDKMKRIKGRLYLCSKSIVFEPEDMSRGIIRVPFEKMTVPPSSTGSAGLDDASSSSSSFLKNEDSITTTTTATTATSHSERCITLETKRYIVMKKNNKIAPYETYDKLSLFKFTFQHSSTQSFVQLFEKIYNVPTGQLQNVIEPMCDQPFDASNFRHLNETPMTVNLRAFLLGPFPLVKKAGCVIVTDQRLYFQPFSGVYSEMMASRALSWCLEDVVSFARRYHGLKDEALEIFFNLGPSVLLAFEGCRNREEVLRLLPSVRRNNDDVVVEGEEEGMSIPVFCHTDRSFLSLVVDAWINGQIDNFDYLLALNSAAGRSLFDLSRYPVFPWVLSDYESAKLDISSTNAFETMAGKQGKDGSLMTKVFRDLTKPIGALNEERLESFKARWNNMQDMGDAFLYGTHYSAPGYCLYYLVRTMPEQMLCLQNGKYDAPDRLFHSIEQCYSSLLINPADIKESIPQFYDPKSGVDILLNLRGLQLGVTQNGIVIDDVKLPNWAKSPKDFLKKNRKALESDYCAKYLPSWIDLIFGVKARGEMAFNYDNLFHPNSYLCPKDLDQMVTDTEKMQAELHATEFGICPDVLFSDFHPRKNDRRIDHSALIAPDDGRSFIQNSDLNVDKRKSLSSVEASQLLKSIQPKLNVAARNENVMQESPDDDNKDNKTAMPNNSDIIEINPNDFSIGNDSALDTSTSNILLSGSGVSTKRTDTKTYDDENDSPLPSITPSKSDEVNNRFEKVDGWTFKAIACKQIHGGEVSGCHLLNGECAYITTTSLDGGLMVHTLPTSGINERRTFSSTAVKSRYQGRNPSETSMPLQFHTFRSHQSSDPLSCLAIINDENRGYIAFAGGHDDVILAYGIKSACGLASVFSHRDAVSGLVLIEVPFVSDGESTHIMLSSSWDATVKLWNVTVSDGETVRIAKEPFAELYEAETPIHCVDALYIPEVGIIVAAGGAGGSLMVWLWNVDGGKTVLFQQDTRPGHESCCCLKWSNNAEIILYAGYQDGRISSFSFKYDGMYPVGKLNLGFPANCLEILPSCQLIFTGCADGSLRIVATTSNGHFDDGQPLVWNSVNGPSSPGITSLSVIPEKDQEMGFTLATGATDGSIAVFTIKKL
mmetsp:Transcript_16549/g.31348  ORF Transcript_16549/g.31348 Transcript_16549/m.31348 type:complete len:1241 (-) Transcript_16549:660-4382(-)